MQNENKYQNWLTADFNFHLPAWLIAQSPITPRHDARLLHVSSQGMADKHIYDLPDLLRADDLLVLNNTKVIPARLYGSRGTVRVEILLHRKQADGNWLAFARPGKRLRVGDTIVFAPDFTADIKDKRETGEVLIHFNATDDALSTFLQKYGEPPLPPYIKRVEGEAKAEHELYQTIYAKHDGAVAAPTAGLHFTPELFAKLGARGVQRVTVTLHVGAGTFLPVKAERVQDHVMHSEWGEVTPETAAIINQARKDGRRIVAVGTTSLRLLESAADANGTIQPFCGDTDIFITPGYRFKAVDVLMTNFHLPKSTLFMLVCAFGGIVRMKEAYARAIANNYRFYSYGDGMVVERDI